MPELPEVEVVRRGLDDWVVGRTVEATQILDPRSIRRHIAGIEDFGDQLVGSQITAAVRRGKFLWMLLDNLTTPTALVGHLGMSGQLLIEESVEPDEKHLKVRFSLSPVTGKPRELRFIDQRIFGGMFLSPLVPTKDGLAGGVGSGKPFIPEAAAHIARDILDPVSNADSLYQALRKRNTQLKRALLDQEVISGVGNIYADEALWQAKLHGLRSTKTIRRPDVERLYAALVDVMSRALEAGGTSFDALYVNVNGASGYFDRSLNAYGREGEACHRCAGAGFVTLIRRDAFMGRSSYSCPRCQRKPR
ncbi:DNA-formamidopyrimidine glycosylase [Arthrobacter sp. MYb227]|uniref:bifunctional DNA-formamidopyrimidine glycosylase/DNA-(apurinic or apyrimidinic site) lyase n=1 Tax=Arthrobacter sp. MYb227 TaxID=1848601 RepID=UPI000CFDF98E|nr:bifunctional DNA-formamidopyrimidine glycosylase/DNA-(apurinic or apyrimidinic site) lyase [Arthrobacter sp. MYb227]PQZ92265.1 DNA-formamidopyrimidine glycosylase [Arthrobacter sp. MYb227]